MYREVYRHGRPVLYESLEAFLRDYPERGLVLETRGDLWGEWDADRLAQLLGNLLLNALTHGVEQEPVRVLAAGEGARVVLEVRNPGGPIPAELLPRLFQPFTRASTGVRRSRGWGWGCSSCRRSSPRTEAASG